MECGDFLPLLLLSAASAVDDAAAAFVAARGVRWLNGMSYWCSLPVGLSGWVVVPEGRARVLLLTGPPPLPTLGLSRGESVQERVSTEASRGFLAWALESTKGEPWALPPPTTFS